MDDVTKNSSEPFTHDQLNFNPNLQDKSNHNFNNDKIKHNNAWNSSCFNRSVPWGILSMTMLMINDNNVLVEHIDESQLRWSDRVRKKTLKASEIARGDCGKL